MVRLRSLTIITGIVLLIALVASAILFPYLLKRYIEKNSEAWIDRHVSIGSIFLNPFTGVYAVSDLTCHEPGSDRVFVSFEKLGIKGNVLDGLMNGHWRFRDAELRNPYVHIAQEGDRFNFSDLLELGGDESGETTGKASSAVVFSVQDIALTGGRIDYESDLLHEPVQLIDVAITCTRITSMDERMDLTVGLGMPDGTRLDGGFMIDTKTAHYAVDARLREFDLAGSLPYLKDLFEAGRLAGKLDVDFHVRQSYADSSDLELSARIDLRGLDLKDRELEHLLTIDRLHARLDTMVGDRFDLGSVEIEGLDTRVALLADGTDNWTRLLKLVSDTSAGGEGAMTLDASESNYFVLLADYVSYLGGTITASDYTADSILFRNGRILFEDHTIPRSLRYDITNIEFRAKRFTASSGTAPVTATATLNGVGKVVVDALFDPNDLRNVDLHVVVDSLMMAPLDPYMNWYAAHPALDGIVRYESRTIIRDGHIASQNRLHIDRLRFGRRQEEHYPGIYVLPLRLAVGLLKDANGVIELDLPVDGDLNDPKFKVWPIVWQVLRNLVVKAVTAPAKMLARLFAGVDERDLEQVRFLELQTVPDKPQQHCLNELSKALGMKPDLNVELVPVVDSLSEARQLALFTAKSNYLLPGTTTLTQEDSLRIQKLASTDSSFVRWMDGRSPETVGLEMAERSARLMGASKALQAWGELESKRRDGVLQYLITVGVEPSRVRVASASPAEMATHGGAPGYLFRYAVREDGE